MRFIPHRIVMLSLVAGAVFTLPAFLFAQTGSSAAADDSAAVLERTRPAVVVILAGKGDGLLEKLGSGVVVGPDGVILTAYHLVRDATQLQVRLKSGEIYDHVELVGFDERRDVAALRIPAAGLTAVEFGPDEIRPGARAYVVSNPKGLQWTVASGLLSETRLADEIPNAGAGFRVLQFSAPVDAGSSGGLLLDEKGRALGLIVATLDAGKSLNFAIPFSSVRGLALSTQTIMAFKSGQSLALPQPVRPPSTIDIVRSDPAEILRSAKIFYISTESVLISEKMMENALLKKPEFAKWKLTVVRDERLADVVISVEHQLYTFDYRFTMTDRRTSIVLATGKVTVWDGNVASGKFARMIIDRLRPLKEPKNPTESKPPEKRP